MTPIPYVTESYTSNEDGKVYGKVSYGASVVDSISEGQETGFKNPGAFDGWARSTAAEHKASISPADTHVIKRSFVV